MDQFYAFDDMVGKFIYGELCYGPPHRLSDVNHALRCHRFRRTFLALRVGFVVGLLAFLLHQAGIIQNEIVYHLIFPIAFLATFILYGIPVRSNYHYWNNMFLSKKDMYMRAGDSEQRANVLADNDIANEFDRRKVAARYAGKQR